MFQSVEAISVNDTLTLGELMWEDANEQHPIHQQVEDQVWHPKQRSFDPISEPGMISYLVYLICGFPQMGLPQNG